MNVRTLFTVFIGAAGASVSLHAQTTRPQLPVDSILARFERQTQAHSNTGDGVGLIVEVFSRSPGGYSPRQDSLLDGLERLVDLSADRDVRSFAALMLGSAGEAAFSISPLPGIVTRLERSYRHLDRIEDHGARSLILSSLMLQGERPAAAALLRAIASQPDTCDCLMEGVFDAGDLRLEALASLTEMGAEGHAVLQAMYRGGEAASPLARGTLEHMAQRGFPVADAVERWKAADRQTIQP